MLGIIVCTHATFADGICKAVEMIAGRQEYFDVLCFQEGEEMLALSEKIKVIAKQYEDLQMRYVVLVDLYGATPFNASAVALSQYQTSVVTGVNLPLLLELVMARDTCEDYDVFLQNALSSAKDSMKIVSMDELFHKKEVDS